MATATESKVDTAIADAAAEKAYAAAAAEKIEAAKPAVAAPAAKVEAPAALAPVATPVPVAKPAPAVKAAPVKSAPAKPAPVAKAAPAKVAKRKKVVAKKAIKPVVAKVATKAAKPAKKTVKITKPVKSAAKAAPKKPVAAKASTFSKFKDTIMAKTQTEDFTAKLSTAVADVQERAKVAYEKGTVVVGEYTDFSKGNVEALVEAGKIFAAGVQDLGTSYVAEAKSAFATITADVKELAAVKSPTDFFKLQGEILRRNFDAAVSTGSKNSEAVIKLANDAFAPLSSRVSLAIEKVKKAA